MVADHRFAAKGSVGNLRAAMALVTTNGIEELKALIGQEIGPSDWREVTQADIDGEGHVHVREDHEVLQRDHQQGIHKFTFLIYLR